MTVHVHLSMAPTPISASSSIASTSTSRQAGLSSSTEYKLPSFPHSPHSQSAPLSTSIPTPPVILSTSAYNAFFVYPISLTAPSSSSTTRPGSSHSHSSASSNPAPYLTKSSYVSAASGLLNRPSDIWKVFNPALCKNEEMPRLLVLRGCVSTTQGNERERRQGMSTWEREREDMMPATVLKRGTFDIGAIDYRGQ